MVFLERFRFLENLNLKLSPIRVNVSVTNLIGVIHTIQYSLHVLPSGMFCMLVSVGESIQTCVIILLSIISWEKTYSTNGTALTLVKRNGRG